ERDGRTAVWDLLPSHLFTRTPAVLPVGHRDAACHCRASLPRAWPGHVCRRVRHQRRGIKRRLLPTFCACGPRGARESLWFWCCGLLDGAGLLRTHASSERNSLSDYGRPARGPRGRAALVLVSAART